MKISYHPNSIEGIKEHEHPYWKEQFAADKAKNHHEHKMKESRLDKKYLGKGE